MAWTDQMIEDLKRMWDEGLSTGEIGKRLGVTKNSIIGKVHRLQLTARPSPIKKKEDGASSAPKAKEALKLLGEDARSAARTAKKTFLPQRKVKIRPKKKIQNQLQTSLRKKKK